MIAVNQTPQPRVLPLPCSPAVMKRLMALGWSRAAVQAHVVLASQLGLDPLSLCPEIHGRVFDA